MNIQRKLEIAKQAIASIGTHEDMDAALLKAALDNLIADINATKTAIDERVAADIAAALAPAPAPVVEAPEAPTESAEAPAEGQPA